MCERIEPLPLAADYNSQLHQEENSVPNTRNQMVNAIEGTLFQTAAQPNVFPETMAKAPVRASNAQPQPLPSAGARDANTAEGAHMSTWFYGSQVSHQGTQVVDISHSSTFLLMRHWKTSRKDYGFALCTNELLVSCGHSVPKSRIHRRVENILKITLVEAKLDP